MQVGGKVLISERNDEFSTMEKGMHTPQINSRIAELTAIWLTLFTGLKLSLDCLAGLVETPNALALMTLPYSSTRYIVRLYEDVFSKKGRACYEPTTKIIFAKKMM